MYHTATSIQHVMQDIQISVSVSLYARLYTDVMLRLRVKHTPAHIQHVTDEIDAAPAHPALDAFGWMLNHQVFYNYMDQCLKKAYFHSLDAIGATEARTILDPRREIWRRTAMLRITRTIGDEARIAGVSLDSNITRETCVLL